MTRTAASNSVQGHRSARPDILLDGSHGLTLVENRIRSVLRSDAPLLTEVSEYLLSLGGKRIRPVLALASARLFGMKLPSSDLIDAAAGIELIHMATLLHDDIIDESPLRRSKMSAYLRYGITPTLLAGDFLLVRAFGLCTDLDKHIGRVTELACVELTEGELLEGHLSLDRSRSLDDYLDIIGKKTGALFAVSANVGAFLSGASTSCVEHMDRFGRLSGMAFQIVDDILDVTADEDLLGKPVGTDLKQKTPSIINLLWLNSGSTQAREFFSLADPSAQDCKDALKIVLQSCVIEQSRSYATHYATRALSELQSLGDHSIDVSVRADLESLVRYTLERCM